MVKRISHLVIEHWRSANNLTAALCKDEPFGERYATKHPEHTGNPELKLKIITFLEIYSSAEGYPYKTPVLLGRDPPHLTLNHSLKIFRLSQLEFCIDLAVQSPQRTPPRNDGKGILYLAYASHMSAVYLLRMKKFH